MVAVDSLYCLVTEDADLMHLRYDVGEFAVVRHCRFILGDGLEAFSSLTLSICIALGLRTSAPESSVSSFLFLFNTHHPPVHMPQPQVNAVMGGGAISFSFRRRCGRQGERC